VLTAVCGGEGFGRRTRDTPRVDSPRRRTGVPDGPSGNLAARGRPLLGRFQV